MLESSVVDSLAGKDFVVDGPALLYTGNAYKILDDLKFKLLLIIQNGNLM